MEGAFLLDVVVGEGAAVLQLLAGEDKPLLVRGDPLLVLQQVNYKSTIYNQCPKINLNTTSYLDLSLHILDGVRGLHLEGDGLASQGLHKDLHLQWMIGMFVN